MLLNKGLSRNFTMFGNSKILAQVENSLDSKEETGP